MDAYLYDIFIRPLNATDPHPHPLILWLQVWPISCALGTVLGHVGGLLVASAYLVHLHRRANKLKLV